MLFTSKNPQFEHLKKKWGGKQKAASENFLQKHGETLRKATIGGLGGLVLATIPGGIAPVPTPQAIVQGIAKTEDKNVLLREKLKGQLPEEVRKLTPEEEKNIETILSDNLGLNVKAELSGIRLNRSYGLIGGEQHLYRYPGDTLEKHADNTADWAMYGGSGIAPGLGAWGYFTSSEGNFTPEDKMRERYYLAVPTFLSPGFSENFGKYRDFYKFRKMLVVNPKTGQAVVAVVGDAGPAEWTGKHLGGSPEVMHYVGLAEGPRKGAVLYFFIDDPENKVPLGPINSSNNFLAMKGGS
ncbi:MAG: hypothetical protein Q7R97_02620 [Candidatus Daviesbacteria bacterium]|nr:hypothetical protein [Candidatus Daviesbacteria bacterium]